MNIPADDSIAKALASAIQNGEVDELKRMLSANPELATARLVDGKGAARTLLHVAADWPGHFPNGAKTVAALIDAGADPNAPMIGPHPHKETPLHWAASSNDIAVLDALLDGGADIEAPGAVFTNGTPLSDAVIFAQWDAARRLVARGARTKLFQAAALGLTDRLESHFSGNTPSSEEITGSFWHACRGGQRQTAEFLLLRGANLNWIGWNEKTPLKVAEESGNQALIVWLRSQGAK